MFYGFIGQGHGQNLGQIDHNLHDNVSDVATVIFTSSTVQVSRSCGM